MYFVCVIYTCSQTLETVIFFAKTFQNDPFNSIVNIMLQFKKQRGVVDFRKPTLFIASIYWRLYQFNVILLPYKIRFTQV